MTLSKNGLITSRISGEKRRIFISSFHERKRLRYEKVWGATISHCMRKAKDTATDKFTAANSGSLSFNHQAAMIHAALNAMGATPVIKYFFSHCKRAQLRAKRQINNTPGSISMVKKRI